MVSLDTLDILFVVTAFLFQIVLIAHFAARRRAFDKAMRYGPIVYALSIPALGLSLAQIAAGKPWTLWAAGILYLVWATFGYWVEYVRHIEWRDPIRPAIFAPYIILYLATVMFYWWPLANLYRPLWFVYGGLFILATILNVASHRRPVESERPRLT